MKSNFLKSINLRYINLRYINLRYINLKQNYLTILKIVLSFYILFAIYVNHDIVLELTDDTGIKIIILFVILYFINIDYTLSILISIILIIMIILNNKNNINKIKTNLNLNKIEKNINNENIVNKTKNEETLEYEENENNASLIQVETFIFNKDKLENIQNNIFNKKNDNIYMSGNYINPLITAQGKLEQN